MSAIINNLKDIDNDLQLYAENYDVGYVSFAVAITQAKGTVNETGFFGPWNQNRDNSVSRFMLFHDIWGSSVNYATGNILKCSYSIAL